MKGLALSRAYFSEAIRPLLAKRVTEIGQSYAAALLGWGSDVLESDGALDQWIGNYDLLVGGVGKLKSLSPVYDNLH